MSNQRAIDRTVQRSLGALGLLLIGLLTWAAEHSSRAGHDPASLGRRWLGLMAIELVTIVGRIVDSLPLGLLTAAPGAQPARQVQLAQPRRSR